MSISRRAVLGGLLSSAAGAVFADAPLSSLRPVLRPGGQSTAQIGAPPLRPSLAQLIADANLDGRVGCVLADARTGVVLDQVDGDVALPPASVTKAVTALYALDALGGAFRFVTQVFAVGTVDNGILDGDLVLAGGGDPTLSSDDLAELAAAVKAAGIMRVRGRFLCWRGALPYVEEIEPSQLDHLGYNPSVSGLNLNFNRVHFEWKRSGGVWQTTMDARTGTRTPLVSMARVQIVDRAGPVFATDAPDVWTVAQSALGDGGARWMPVRQPALYAGDVFATLAREVGITLPAPEVVDVMPGEGRAVAQHSSATLRTILQGMLRFSTNLTAEVCGMMATRSRLDQPFDIVGSAAEMNRWVDETYGIETGFTDHSGLSDQNRISAVAMAKLLAAAGVDGPLPPILRTFALQDSAVRGVDVRAKTGTLNFVSALAGYIETSDGSDLVFAIFCADFVRRDRGILSGAERPAGAVTWNRRARRLQQDMLQRWGLMDPSAVAVPALD